MSAQSDNPTTTADHDSQVRSPFLPPAQEESRSSQDIPEPAHAPSKPSPASPVATATEQPPTFSSFFALIEDSNTGEHYHPTVHYVFSDDDADIITDAALQTLENDATTSREDEGFSERYVLLDLDASGTTVTSAHSLTSKWQVLKADISPAPTWDGQGETLGGEGGTTGLMLRIEGTEGMSFRLGKEAEEVNIEALMDDYEKRMVELRRIMAAGLATKEGKDR